MMKKIHLLLSTRNKDKRHELSRLLGEDVILHSPDEYTDEEVEETADTLYGNAYLKAEDGFRRSGLPSVADDTGLEVDALDGRPGVYSSRFAGPDATYEDNVNKLLVDIKSVDDPARTARFKTVIVYIDENGVEQFEGTVEGKILKVKRGNGGFGYDPVFLPDGFDLTLAEMNTDDKNKISHRGIAFRKFVDWWEKRNS